MPFGRENRGGSRLRRSQSSSSTALRSLKIDANQDPIIARQHAVTAAEIAFDRSRGSSEGLTAKTLDPNVENGLRRKQSIRFAGPNAIPARQLHIRRTQASTSIQLGPNSPKSTSGYSAASASGALVGYSPSSGRGNRTASASSYKKLRKAKSMFVTRSNQPPVFSHAVPRRWDDRHTKHTQTSGTLLSGIGSKKGSATVVDGSLQENQKNDRAVELARDEYIRQLDLQSLRQRPSIAALGNIAKKQKSFRRTVRSSSSHSFGPGVSSENVVRTEPSLSKTASVGSRVRRIPSNLKYKLKRTFLRSSSSERCVPQQHIDAQRQHYGEFGNESHSGSTYAQTPENELVSRLSSRESSIHRLPVELNQDYRPGSIRSVKSAESTGTKSRVTSWTNSTVSELTRRFLPTEAKRLSIIQENGSPHKPSSSAGLVGNGLKRGYSLFRRPLRSLGTTNEPMDSKDMFSALQERIDRHKNSQQSLGGYESMCHEAPGSSSLRVVSAETSATNDTIIRRLEDLPEESSSSESSIRGRNALELVSRDVEDDVFKPSPAGARHKKSSASTPSAGSLRRTRIHEDLPVDAVPPLLEVQQSAKRLGSDGSGTILDWKQKIPERPLSRTETHMQPLTEPSTTVSFLEKKAMESAIFSDSASVYSRGIDGASPQSSSATDRVLRKPSSASINGARKTVQPKTSLTRDSSLDWNPWCSTQPIGGLTSRANEKVSHTTYGSSKHRREGAQMCGDETDELAQAYWRIAVNKKRNTSADAAATSSLRSSRRQQRPAALASNGRQPLANRNISQTSNIQEPMGLKRDTVSSKTSLRFVAQENERQSSTSKVEGLGILVPPRKASMGSLRSEGLKEVTNTAPRNGSIIPVGLPASPRQGYKYPHGGGMAPSLRSRSSLSNISNSTNSRHSPDRLARLRRMQSHASMLGTGSGPGANSCISTVQESPHTPFSKQRAHQNVLFTQGSPRAQFATNKNVLNSRSGGEPGISGSSLNKKGSGGRLGFVPATGSRMVEQFLSSRRDEGREGRQVSEQSVCGAAFI